MLDGTYQLLAMDKSDRLGSVFADFADFALGLAVMDDPMKKALISTGCLGGIKKSDREN